MSVFALGIELDGEGFHPAAWRRAGHEPDQLLTARTLRERVAAAENAGFTFATFDDSILPPATGPAGRIDGPTRAAFVAPITSTIGLVPTVATTYAEPFHTTSQLATLDYASRGRAGWLATQDPAAARTWGRPAVTGPDALVTEQRDSVEVARRLWDSWEDDAVVRDYTTGRFLDRDKLHYADFVGQTFSVKGPSIVPRPPQGQIVVFAGDTTTDADVVLVNAELVQEVIDALDAARSASGALVVAEVEVVLDTPDVSASERLAALEADETAESRGRLRFSGSANDLVALLTQLAQHADGVRLHPAVLDEDLPVLARAVVPALLRAGIAHRPVPGSTLRSNLGLHRPSNRYAKDQH
ncbi:LLM class flavin-dependent oxidoreductase [Nocardia sp. NPDC058176]|uniref:LLM class flavin-dependent oxidoreductase n=1 Tax=Nocardia sp. NPDC058176 TaxID=3346368 RepID=UPI0036DBFF7B